jgi:hypothetical protein
MVTFAVVMAACQMVLEAHLAWVNDGRSEKDVPLGLAPVEGIILIANRVGFFPDAPLQGRGIKK